MKNTLTAIATVAFSFAALVSIRSPLMPLFATAGAASGAHLLTVYPASQSRRQRQLEVEAKESRRKIEEERNQKLAVVEERSQLVETATVHLVSQEAHLEETEKRLLAEKERLAQEAKGMQQWAEEYQRIVMSLAVTALKENNQLKQPDLPDGGEYEDLVSEKICWLLHKSGVICKGTTVRPFKGGFTMCFSILPARPDVDDMGEERRYVQGIAEAKKKIEADLLTEIQANIYDCDKLPEVTVGNRQIKLTVWLSKYQPEGTAKIPEISLEDPVRPSLAKYGFPGVVTNDIIDFYWEVFEAKLDFKDCRGYPDGQVLVWLKPDLTTIKDYKIKQSLEDLQLHLEIDEKPKVDVDDGFLCFEIETRDRIVKEKKRQAKEPQRLLPPEEFIDLIGTVGSPESDVFHFFISGESGSGKSTLLNNIVDFAKQKLGQDLKIIIIDPKDPDTAWLIDGKRVVPDYGGIDAVMDGLTTMNEDVEQRLELERNRLYKNIPAPERIPTLYIVDEAEWIVSEYGSDASKCMKNALRVGRSSKVICAIVGQDPGCKAYGMHKANLRNAARIYLADNAMAGAQEVCPTLDMRKSIEKLLAEQMRKAEVDRTEKFYCLLKISGKPPKVCKLPRENAFKQEVSANPEEQVELQNQSDTAAPIDLLDLVDEAKNQALVHDDQREEAIARLNEVWDNSDELYLKQAIEKLPKHLKGIVEFAIAHKDWITSSLIRQQRNAYKQIKSELIQDWFEELERMGIGECDRSSKTIKYQIPIIGNS